MITIRKNKVIFKGQDAVHFKTAAKELGLSPQTLLTALLWEKIMQIAREGSFKKRKK